MTKLYAYPAIVETDDSGKVSVWFEGLPGSTWGESREDALEHAKDLLATAIEMLIEDGAAIPLPSPPNGRPIVEAVLD